MSLPEKTINDIKSLIQKFIDENGFVKSEEDVQSSYTLDILKLLGWNSSNWKINTSQEIKTGNKPDILLKGSGGGTIFIIESKAPGKDLDGKSTNKTFKDQTCDYCNSEGIYWGVLTNFIEWRIYNSYRRELYYNKKYFTIIDNKVNDVNELFDFFEKITFKNLDLTRGKISTDPIYYKKQEEIKDEFFANLKLWRHKLRTYLYNKLKTNNKYLLQETCEKLTQKILDRLIFMEVCNDKNIISYDILGSILHSKVNKYEELKSKFKELDEKFNSDLFAEDVYCDGINIDDDPMEQIIRGINNIDFSKLSVHIIGEVYENYLGELLRTSKQEIKLVESKERAKRKEQGIYYTPDYIVNYIVENTLGKILKNCKTEEEIQKIRVLDPACGSGSFLIRAFDEFYNAYKRIHLNVIPASSNLIPTKAGNQKKSSKTGQMTLFDDFDIKKKILLYNLYGVDLDERAVDIAKLNLLIKALEGFTENSLTGRKLLPNLKLNIRCGNSLVSGKSMKDLTDGSLFDNSQQFKKDIDILIGLKEKFKHSVEDKEKENLLEEISIHEEKINSYLNKDLKQYFKNLDDVKPLNYEVAFCEIFNDGGFDCVIGNPPYINVENIPDKMRIYLMNEYKFIVKRFDIYIAFIEIGLKNLKNSGLISLIVPYPFLNQNYAQNIREFILEKYSINKIVDLSDYKIFPDAVVRNIIFAISKYKVKNNIIEIIKPANGVKLTSLEKVNIIKLNQNTFNHIPKSMFRTDINKYQLNIIKKINDASINVDNICYVNWGLRTGDIKKYVVTKKINNLCKPMLDGRDIDRYQINYNNKFVIYDKNELYNPMFEELFENDKLIIRDVSGKNRLKATYDNNNYYTEHTVSLCVMKHSIENVNKKGMLFSREEISLSKNYNIKFILALINSFLINSYFQWLLGGGLHVYPDDIKNLPVRLVDFKNKQEKSLHDKLVIFVDEMLKLNKTPEKNKIKIKAKDKEIDDLVYKLYGLTEDEIKVVQTND